MSPEEIIKKLALKNGASVCGFAPAGPLAEHARFLRALEDLPPSLGYLARDPEKRADIRNWFAGARSVLICGFSYWPQSLTAPGRVTAPEATGTSESEASDRSEPPAVPYLTSGRAATSAMRNKSGQGLCPSDGLVSGLDYEKTLEGVGEPEAFLERSGRKIKQPGFFEAGNRRIARYALGSDYHAAVKEKLLKIIEGVKSAFSGSDGRAFVDTAPVLEKELGRLAGLGFRGKNTLLINPGLGSYFVIGGVALNLELEPGAPLAAGCGDCDLCVKACPGEALKDGRLFASKCVSYLTTQATEKIPAKAVLNSGGFAYGCDICQKACPFNK